MSISCVCSFQDFYDFSLAHTWPLLVFFFITWIFHTCLYGVWEVVLQCSAKGVPVLKFHLTLKISFDVSLDFFPLQFHVSWLPCCLSFLIGSEKLDVWLFFVVRIGITVFPAFPIPSRFQMFWITQLLKKVFLSNSPSHFYTFIDKLHAYTTVQIYKL